MSAIKKIRLSDSVVDALKEMLAQDGFAPGDKFYSEKELTEKLEVSRSSVREAVRIIEANGLVSVMHGKGIFVNNPAPNEFDAFSEWLKSNEQSIQDLFEVRLILEPRAAWSAAKNADANIIARMEEVSSLFEQSVKKDNTEDAILYDRKFHKHLAQATKNKTLFLLMKAITTSLFDGWISSLHMPGRMQKTVKEHRLVLQAIKTGDADGAMECMKAHLDNAIKDIQASIKLDEQ